MANETGASRKVGIRRLSAPWLRALVAAVVLFAAVAAIVVYRNLFRERPPQYFESDENHFLFGSVGTETTDGVAYWVWLVLPRVFPDLLPGPGGMPRSGSSRRTARRCRSVCRR